MSPITEAQHILDLVKSLSRSSDVDTSAESESARISPLAAWTKKTEIQNACDRLLLSVLGPLEYTVLIAESCQESQALYFVSNLGIADLIGESEEGRTLAELSEQANVQPQFLGVAMSCILGRGFFEEVGKFGSKVYKNNALSEVLREGHSESLNAAIGLVGDEGFKAASRLLDAAKVITNDETLTKVPAMNIAFDFSGSIFEWMSSPEQAWRGERLGRAMQQLHRMANSNVPEDYPWHNLSSPIVDIGGGVGSLEMALLKDERHKHLKFIIFDIEKTTANGKKMWNAHPASANVIFVAGSFMDAFEVSTLPRGQPTYIIRHVIHDWTDADVIAILSHVRLAMAGTPHSRLLVVEMLLRADSPRFARMTSMQLLALNSGITRTQDAVEALVRAAGFSVECTTHMRAADSVIEATVG